MPLMMLLLDSSSSNYSSARFDGQMFWRGVAKTQGWLGRILARIESLVAREAELMGMLPASPPDLMRQFVWPRAPHVDPVKEAEAERMALQNGSLSYTQLCAANGTSIERMIAQRKRDNELLKAAGLPEIPGIDSAQKTAEINAKLNNPGEDPPADEDRLPYEQPTSGTPSPPVRKARWGVEVPSVN
jgi:capsid protein